MSVDVIARLLAVDQVFQGMVLTVNVLALMLTCRLLWDAIGDWRAVRGNGSSQMRAVLAWQGVRTQAVMMCLQAGFLIITIAVMTLPPIPVYTMGTEITLVIGVRKLVRALLIMILAYHSWTSQRTRMIVLAMLEDRA